MAGRGFLFCRKGRVREIMRPIPIPGADGVDGPLGPVRRDPPRRPRADPRLIGLGLDLRRRRRLTRARRLRSSAESGRSPDPDLPTFDPEVAHRRACRHPSRSDPAADRARCRSGRPAACSASIPDTLRRWADEGRIEAFTTAGGHRRFHRATVERILEARRHDATIRLATPRRHDGPTVARLPARLLDRRPTPATSATRSRRRPRRVPRRRPRARRARCSPISTPPTTPPATRAEASAVALTEDLARPARRGRDPARRGGLPVRRGPPPVPDRARRDRPPPVARPGPAGRDLRQLVGPPRSAAAPARRRPPGGAAP